MTDALVSGLLAGYGIAMPVGAMSVLIVTLASRVSFRHAMAAAMGVATADGLYALAAVLGGAGLARLIQPASRPLQVLAAGVLACIALKGLVSAVRTHHREVTRPSLEATPQSLRRTYSGLVGLTLLNPVTIVYFGALVVGHRGGSPSPASGLLFVVAAFVASASWQAMLATSGALLRRTLTGPRSRLVTALAGNSVILGLAAHLVW
ncbi:LysE/ArgO family amino acid transporter [Streptomyces cellostaticus]|uniref:LysE/ArgO family amino acid transporter n=1 Tax=Streptomyces cellostaticus TaxID=67285 RepID=UPI002026F595|nr:LysE family transporter [Streptomyces cellostaticus]